MWLGRRANELLKLFFSMVLRMGFVVGRWGVGVFSMVHPCVFDRVDWRIGVDRNDRDVRKTFDRV